MSEIKTIPFTKKSIATLDELKFGSNWPVVYLLNNKRNIYIGESSNLYNRMKSHIRDEDKKKLKELTIVYDKRFNKSAALDIESLLIQYFGADNKFRLKNKNRGQSQSHEYYQRKFYLDQFEPIWAELKDKALVEHELDELRNSKLFKFSPYKTLTVDQFNTSQDLLFDLLKNLNTSGFSSVINGEAGTGKTVLAVYFMKLLQDSIHNTSNMEDLEDEEEIYTLLTTLKNLPKFEIALVIPMTSLRKTLKAVFHKTEGLRASMVIGPSDVYKKDYDLLIVDEAHRLKRRMNMAQYGTLDKINEFLRLNEDATELEWILKCSKYQILFYDKSQTVKPTDVREDDFRIIKANQNTRLYNLSSQMRILGGDDYIKYLTSIFSDVPPKKKINFSNYDIQVFDHIDDMVKEIKTKNISYGLCRVVAGYAWAWKSKDMKYKDIVKQGISDIQIEGHNYIWNTTNDNWVNSEHAIDEIGCIHTVQGYDLNYTGVIIGNEIVYNEKTKRIEIDESKYHDMYGKRSASPEELHVYIINIYKVLMTRGIRGTYIYVCDKKLRKYLKKYL